MVKAQLRFPIYLSIAAAVVTLVLKTVSYLITNSVGLLSDAAESLVNLVAALTIAWYAVLRMIRPEQLGELGPGLLLSCLAAAINGGVAVVLLRAGRKNESIVLEADGWHLLTDVWTSGAVLLGLGLVMMT